MAENSKIEWTDHTFNAWVGCTKVSAACDHCYAEAWARRSGQVQWGNHPRKRTSEAYWRQPLKWNRIAERDGVRRKVFCCSLADVFDNQAQSDWREALWRLINETPHLDWLLLTKRPQNIAKMLPTGIGLPGWPWPNVWLGTTVENQEEADRRIPHLLAVPAAKRFLSCEPLLGSVDLRHIAAPQYVPEDEAQGWTFSALETGDYYVFRDDLGYWESGDGPYRATRIDWVIAGGESGPGARPMHPDWARSLRDQCQAAGVPFFFKQWGEWGLEDPGRRAEPHALASDGTLYRMADIAYPSGARYGEAFRADHASAHLHTVYRVGKARAGAALDGREHRSMPSSTDAQIGEV